MEGYSEFLERRAQLERGDGVPVSFVPDQAFGFQRALIEWACENGRGAVFADCGLGKSLIQLAWAENVRRHSGKPVLVLTPLAVSFQTVSEGHKFGIDSARSGDGSVTSGITVTNYERLGKFNPEDFSGVVCDESSILKSFDGVTRKSVTEFMRKTPYRLLCTATAAPNDYIELGTSSEALGYLGHTDMLTRFFKNDEASLRAKRSIQQGKYQTKWRFKGHAEAMFWRWVSSWARAVRRPSDLGFADDGFILPPLIENQHVVQTDRPRDGLLFHMPVRGLQEEREERRRTIGPRCERVAELVTGDQPALVWCHLNEEGDMLERLIQDSVQVSGADSDDAKEEKFLAFQRGEARVLVTKPKIGAWGLNFQHCAHETFFPSHSFEQYYQGVRRCWRFGQKRSVVVDVVTSDGERDVMGNLQRKAKQSEEMFAAVVQHMQGALRVSVSRNHNNRTEVPSWL
jgi:hypothetical protein